MTVLALIAATMAFGQESTHELTFKGATETTLSGELMLPEGAGLFPCALLLPGSGPTDRNGNQPPQLITDVLKQIAEHLAKNGVATFRFDKRPAHVNAKQWPPLTDMGALSEYFSFENHVADVAAAYKAMAAQPKVDPKRLAILGHSEGGLFACWEAHLLNPRAVVLVGTAGTSMVDVLRFQIGQNIGASALPEERKKAIIDSNEKAMKTIVDSGKVPEDVDPVLKSLYNASALKLLRSYMTIDPTVPLAQYQGPVLVLNGEKDAQVRATVDAPRLFEALKRRKGGAQELFVVPGASHCLKTLTSEPGSAFVGPIVPAALEKIAAWLKAKLG